MAGSIKGITVEIGGNTTKLGKALNDVNTKTRNLQRELKGVNTLLKYDPTNVILIKQKQDLLNTSIANTREKLDKLKVAQAQVQEQFDKGEITEEQFRDFQREIVATEQKLESLEKEAKIFGSTVSASIISANEKLEQFGNKTKAAGEKLLPVTAVVTAIGAAGVKTAADFESAMSQVAATMGMTADEINNGSKEFEKLEQAAKDMGSTTQFSASEAAEALNYLALAGYDVDKSIETLPQILNLAAAGGLELATASDMVTDAMSALGSTAGSTESFVDKMAKTSQKSNTSVAQLGEAILTVGGTAKVLSGGVTELNTCLGILADNGIKGAEGGTALRNMILSLSSPTDTAAGLMEKLGLKVFDAEGNMRPLNDTFGDLNTILSTMSDSEKTEVLSTIFNKTDLKSANALLANCGDRFDELSGYIDDSKNAAANMAETMNNNLNGQLTALKSALEGILIEIGNALLPAIKNIVTGLQNWATWFSNLDQGSKNIIITLGLIAGAIGPLLMLIGNFALKLNGLIDLGIRMAPVFANIGTALKGLFGIIMAHPIISVITAIVAAVVYLWNTNENFRNAVIEIFNNVVDFVSSCCDNLVKFFTETVPNSLQSMCDWFSSLPGIIGDYISNVITVVTEWFSQLPYNIGLWIGSTLSNIINWGIDMKAKASEIGSQFIENISNFIKNLPSNIWNWLINTYNKAIDWGNRMKAKASEIGSQFVSTVVNFIKNLPSNISTWFSTTIQRAIQFANDFSAKGKSAATDFSTKILEGIKSIPGKVQSAGKSIVEGLWKGISGAGSWLANKIKGFADNVVKGFKDSFKINSPAKVMIPIGQGIDEGVGLGIEENADIPIESAEKMVDGVVGVNFERSLNNTFRSNSVATAPVDTVSSSFPESCTFNLVTDGKTIASVSAPFLDVLNGERLNLAERGLILA